MQVGIVKFMGALPTAGSQAEAQRVVPVLKRFLVETLFLNDLIQLPKGAF